MGRCFAHPNAHHEPFEPPNSRKLACGKRESSDGAWFKASPLVYQGFVDALSSARPGLSELFSQTAIAGETDQIRRA